MQGTIPAFPLQFVAKLGLTGSLPISSLKATCDPMPYFSQCFMVNSVHLKVGNFIQAILRCLES